MYAPIDAHLKDAVVTSPRGRNRNLEAAGRVGFPGGRPSYVKLFERLLRGRPNAEIPGSSTKWASQSLSSSRNSSTAYPSKRSRSLCLAIGFSVVHFEELLDLIALRLSASRLDGDQGVFGRVPDLMAALLPIKFPASLLQQGFKILERKTVRVVSSSL